MKRGALTLRNYHYILMVFCNVTVNFKNGAVQATEGLLIEQNVAKSLQVSANSKGIEEMPKVLGSFIIMFIYVAITIGKLDCVENRVNAFLRIRSLDI